MRRRRDDDIRDIAVEEVRDRIKEEASRTPGLEASAQKLLEILAEGFPNPEFKVRTTIEAYGRGGISAVERFPQLLDITVADYINRCRAEVAEILLRKTRWPVWRVSSAAGFNSRGTFHRNFKTFIGSPPGVYRRRWKSLKTKYFSDPQAPDPLELLENLYTGKLDPDQLRRHFEMVSEAHKQIRPSLPPPRGGGLEESKIKILRDLLRKIAPAHHSELLDLVEIDASTVLELMRQESGSKEDKAAKAEHR